jgi:hypothetical protein
MRYMCSKYSQDGELRAHTYVYPTELDAHLPLVTYELVGHLKAERYCRDILTSKESSERGDYWICHQMPGG